MASRRLHFVDVPPPPVIWLMAGSSPAGAVRQAPVGEMVAAGAVVAGVEHTSTVAVTPLPGRVGEVATIYDSGPRQRQAIALTVEAGAELESGKPQGAPALAEVTSEDLPFWIDRLERAGVRADRHNSPDLIAQLVAAVDRPVDSIVCHALEADPTLPVQVQWALRNPLELRDGLRLLARLTGARRAILAVAEGDNRRLFRHLRRSARGEDPGSGPAAVESHEQHTEVHDIGEGQSVMVPFEPGSGIKLESGPTVVADAPMPPRPTRAPTAPASLGLRLIPVLNAYPQADPTLLIWALLSRRLAPGALPTEAGAIVLDAVAATALGAVARGVAVIRRQPLAVRDHRRDVAVLADVWRGTRAIDALQALGLLAEEEADTTLRGGDYLREKVLPRDFVLDGGEVVLHVTAKESPALPDPCIRCGWCLDICPTHVHPAGVLEGAQRHDPEIARQYGVEACIECGVCSYICPSRLPLLKAAQLMKGS